MRNNLLSAALGLVLIATCLPTVSFAQYSIRYMTPTERLLDHEIAVGSDEVRLDTLMSGLGLPFVFDLRIGNKLTVSIDSDTNTYRKLLDLIDATDEYAVIVREWEVLIVSDVDEKRIEEIDSIVRDFENKKRSEMIDQLLEWSHPSVYPTLFWVMKNDTIEMSKKVAQSLLSNHERMMEYSPSFENALEGFERALKQTDSNDLGLAYNLPRPILKDIDPVEILGGRRNEYLEQRVMFAKRTFADMKREYVTSPSSPSHWPMCGTGYVHTLNHFDYAAMIGDLRTEEAYDFLNAQAKELAKVPNGVNQNKLAELAMVLAKRDTDDALEIANIIIEQQNLQQPADSIINEPMLLSNNPTVNLIRVLSATGQAKYIPVYQACCNSGNSNVRREAFSILYRQGGGPGGLAELLDIGRKGLDRLSERSENAKTADEKIAIEQNRFLAASIMSMIDTEEAKQFFLERFEQPEHAMEAAGYLSVYPPKQSDETLKKILDIGEVSPVTKIALRVELLNRNDQDTIAQVLKRMEARYADLGEEFKSMLANGVSYKTFNGFLAYIDSDVEKLRSFPEPVRRGIELLDPENSPEQRMTGAIMVYTAPYKLIDDDIVQSLSKFKNDPDEWINKIANAILDARKE